MPLTFTPAAFTWRSTRTAPGASAFPALETSPVSWTERDELVSESLHYRDMGLGLTRPVLVKTTDKLKSGEPKFTNDLGPEADEIPDVEKQLSRSTHSRITLYREQQLEAGSPVLTSDSTDLWEATVGAMRQQRWVDGQAASLSIEFERAYEQADLIVEEQQLLSVAADWADWAQEIVDFETSDLLIEHVAELIDSQTEREEEASPSKGQVVPWPAALRTRCSAAMVPELPAQSTVCEGRIAPYVETLLWTMRAPAISTWVRPDGREPLRVSECLAQAEGWLAARLARRGLAERLRRESVRTHSDFSHGTPRACNSPAEKRLLTADAQARAERRAREVADAARWQRDYEATRLPPQPRLVKHLPVGGSWDPKAKRLVGYELIEIVGRAKGEVKIDGQWQVRYVRAQVRPVTVAQPVERKPLARGKLTLWGTEGRWAVIGRRQTFPQPVPQAKAPVDQQARYHRVLDYAATHRDMVRELLATRA